MTRLKEFSTNQANELEFHFVNWFHQYAYLQSYLIQNSYEGETLYFETHAYVHFKARYLIIK